MLLIQKEVAERIVARDEKESVLSIAVKAYGSPKIIAKVPAGAFTPAPKVDSAIISIERISRDFFIGVDENLFFKTLKFIFGKNENKLAEASLIFWTAENQRSLSSKQLALIRKLARKILYLPIGNISLR